MESETPSRTEALRALVEAFGGNPPDWLLAEYDAACIALNTPDPVRDTAPDLLAALKLMVEAAPATITSKKLGAAYLAATDAIAKAEGRAND